MEMSTQEYNAKYNLTADDLTKSRGVVEQLIEYYKEHIHSTIMDQLFEAHVIDETDNKGMALIRYATSELLYELNTND
jgi:hypothetical protein